MTKSKQSGVVEKLQGELMPVVGVARKILVKDEKTMSQASEQLSQLNVYLDRIEDEKQKVLFPLNQARTAEINRWKPVVSVLTESISQLRNSISTYQTLEVKRMREEEAKIAARVGEGKGKLSFETAIRKTGEIERVSDEIVVDSGKVKFREDKVLVVVDAKKIPDEYWVLDEKKVLEDLKKGYMIAGAELDIKMIPVNNR